jgi:predicted transposase YdaD
MNATLNERKEKKVGREGRREGKSKGRREGRKKGRHQFFRMIFHFHRNKWLSALGNINHF